VPEGSAGSERSAVVVGHDTTPFLLGYIQRTTQGRSLEVNVSVHENNVSLAGQIAGALLGARA